MAPLFAGTALAARIERAECSLLEDGVASRLRRRGAPGSFVRPIAGGVAAYSAPDQPLNKIAGLGFAGGLDGALLDELEHLYGRVGAPLRFELSTLAEPSIAALLTHRGYVLAGFENVLARSLAAGGTRPIAPGIEVARSAADDFDTWLDVVVTGFAHPDTQGVPSDESYPRAMMEELIGDMACAEGFERYLARRAGEPVGGASMRLCEGVAQLCGAATVPEHRRRGVQSALLTTRLEAARRAGCDVAVVTTQPGSKSQENVQRQGFELLYARAVLVREL